MVKVKLVGVSPAPAVHGGHGPGVAGPGLQGRGRNQGGLVRGPQVLARLALLGQGHPVGQRVAVRVRPPPGQDGIDRHVRGGVVGSEGHGHPGQVVGLGGGVIPKGSGGGVALLVPGQHPPVIGLVGGGPHRGLGLGQTFFVQGRGAGRAPVEIIGPVSRRPGRGPPT